MKNNTKILITGGCGLIGHHFCEHILKNTDWDVVILDRLNYASAGFDRLRDIKAFDDKRVLILSADFNRPIAEGLAREIGSVDYILHLGAESIIEDTYIPIQSVPKIGTRMITFKELWRRQSIKNKPIKHGKGEAIFLKGKQVKALSFYNGGQWMPIKVITRHWYKGKIIKLVQKWGEINATPNHSIYSANLELSNPEKNPALLAIRNINRFGKRYKNINEDVLTILAAYITEGNATFNKANGSYIVEIGQQDKSWLNDLGQKIKLIFGCNYSVSKGKGSYHLQISNKKFYNYILKNCGKYCDGKMFPDRIFDLNKEKQLFFWNKLLEGDGTKDGRYTTTSYKLANQIGLLLALLGYEYKVFESNRKNYKRSWEFKTQLSGNHYGQNQKVKREINYEGWVYDLEVENSHNFACGLGNIVCHNTHVDNSISEPEPFVMSNVVGTFRLLEFAKTLLNLKCFFQFSTDEVFGPAPKGVEYKEEDRHNPTNPYSATKSGAEMLVNSYRNTYKLPAIITRSMNVFGERQDAEKFIPKIIKKVLAGEMVIIHADSTKTKAGSRFYIHARNVADAYLFLMNKIESGDNSIVGQDFHITGEKEVDNLKMARKIAKILGKNLKYKMVDFHSSRPGHDLRYALDGGKIAKLGWNLPMTFEKSLEKTVRWMTAKENKKWLVSGKEK